MPGPSHRGRFWRAEWILSLSKYSPSPARRKPSSGNDYSAPRFEPFPQTNPWNRLLLPSLFSQGRGMQSFCLGLALFSLWDTSCPVPSRPAYANSDVRKGRAKTVPIVMILDLKKLLLDKRMRAIEHTGLKGSSSTSQSPKYHSLRFLP